MDLTKLSITELKALAYDQLIELERIQVNLNVINTQIKTLSTPKVESIEDKDREEK